MPVSLGGALQGRLTNIIYLCSCGPHIRTQTYRHHHMMTACNHLQRQTRKSARGNQFHGTTIWWQAATKAHIMQAHKHTAYVQSHVSSVKGAMSTAAKNARRGSTQCLLTPPPSVNSAHNANMQRNKVCQHHTWQLVNMAWQLVSMAQWRNHAHLPTV